MSRLPETKLRWNVNSTDRIEDIIPGVPHPLINPLKKNSSDFFVNFLDTTIDPYTAKLISIELPNTFYNVQSVKNTTFSHMRFDDESGTPTPYGYQPFEVEQQRFKSFSDFFTWLNDLLSGRGLNDDISLNYKMGLQKLNYLIFLNSLEPAFRTFNIDLDYSAGFFTFNFAAANSPAINLGFNIASYTILTAYTIMTLLGEIPQGFKYPANNAIVKETPIVINDNNNLITGTYGVNQFKINIPNGNYRYNDVFSGSTFCGRTDRIEPTYGVKTSRLFYFPTLSNAIYERNLNKLPGNANVYILYRKEGTVFGDPLRPIQERFVINIERPFTLPTILALDSSSPLKTFGSLEHIGGNFINLFSGYDLPLTSFILRNLTAGFLGFYIIRTKSLTSDQRYIDHTKVVSNLQLLGKYNDVLEDLVEILPIAIPPGEYSSNTLISELNTQLTLSGSNIVAYNGKTAFTIAVATSTDMLDSYVLPERALILSNITVESRPFFIALSSDDPLTYSGTNYDNEMEITRILNIIPRLTTESSIYGTTSDYPVVRNDLNFFDKGNDIFYITIAFVQTALTVSSGSYDVDTLATEITTLVVDAALGFTVFEVVFNHTTMLFEITGDIVFTLDVTSLEYHNILPTMGFLSSQTGLSLIAETTPQLATPRYVFIGSSLISGNKNVYSNYSDNLTGMLARVPLNVTKEEIVYQQHGFPEIIANYRNLEENQLSGMVNIQINDMAGIPIDNIGSEWSMEVEIEY